jgi:(p)ppGpp synthase/HD superfamily hydrolase
MTTLDAAIDLAARAHEGQTDRVGAPYIAHPTAVMARVTTDEEKTVAVLHDVVEDTDTTLDDLRRHGFDDRVVGAVDAVSKRPGESLEESMRRVLDEPTGLARTVKLADLSHNGDPDRLAELDDATRERLVVKYRRSAELLGTDLETILAGHRSRP